MNRTSLYTILSSLFVGCLLISNILAFKLIDAHYVTLTAGVIIFPIVYIVNDVLAEIYGFKNARRTILLGFAINLLAVIAYNVAIALKAPVWFAGSDAFATVLSSTARILIASFTAYLIGTTLNSLIMVKMRGIRKPGSKGLFIRAVTSTMVGESIDALIFVTIAFLGSIPLSVMFTMIIAQAVFKTAYEIVVFPVTKLVIKYVVELPEGGLY